MRGEFQGKEGVDVNLGRLEVPPAIGRAVLGRQNECQHSANPHRWPRHFLLSLRRARLRLQEETRQEEGLRNGQTSSFTEFSQLAIDSSFIIPRVDLKAMEEDPLGEGGVSLLQ